MRPPLSTPTDPMSNVHMPRLHRDLLVIAACMGWSLVFFLAGFIIGAAL